MDIWILDIFKRCTEYKDWVVRRKTVEITAIIKMILPVILMVVYINWKVPVWITRFFIAGSLYYGFARHCDVFVITIAACRYSETICQYYKIINYACCKLYRGSIGNSSDFIIL